MTAKINTKKELFCNTGVRGKEVVLYLLELAIEDINSRIDRFKGEKEDLRRQEITKRIALQKIEDIQDGVMRFLKQRVQSQLLIKS